MSSASSNRGSYDSANASYGRYKESVAKRNAIPSWYNHSTVGQLFPSNGSNDSFQATPNYPHGASPQIDRVFKRNPSSFTSVSSGLSHATGSWIVGQTFPSNRSVAKSTMTSTENGSSSNNNSKEVQTTEAKYSGRKIERQPFSYIFVLMTMRDREKELACLFERHIVSKFNHRGRIQAALGFQCYKRWIVIQDRHRFRSSSEGSDVSQSQAAMHLFREKYKTNSENIVSGTSSSLVSSRGWILNKYPHKATERPILQETIEKSDLRETQEVISAVENAKKAVLCETAETKSGLIKYVGESTIQKKTFNQKRKQKKKYYSEGTAEGRGEMTKEIAVSERVDGSSLIDIADQKVNPRNSKKKKKNRRRVLMENGKSKTEGKDNKTNEVLKEDSRRISNVETAERGIASSKETGEKKEIIDGREISRETTRGESAEKDRRKKEEDFVSLEANSKEITEDKSMNPQEEKSTSHGTRVRNKEKNSIHHGEEMWILRNSEVMSAKEIDRNNWDEKEMEEEEEEEDKYGDYDDYNGENMDNWIQDIWRPRIYWKDQRKERHLEVFNTDSEKGILRFGDSIADQSTQETQVISDFRGQMEQLQREMLELRNSVKSCIDMQLHFQKSVTQDLSCSGSSAEQRDNTKKDPLKRKCCVCSELPVDALLYRCGHMCACLKCAHELQWSSKKCPICMAPILDVVRVFFDS